MNRLTAGLLLGLIAGVPAGAAIQHALKQSPMQLDLFTADTGVKVCINGFMYQFNPSDKDELPGGSTDILTVVTEPKGEPKYGPDGHAYPMLHGPKACAASR